MCHGAKFVRNPSGTGNSHWPDSRVIKIATFFHKIIDLLKQENKKKKNEWTNSSINNETNEQISQNLLQFKWKYSCSEKKKKRAFKY